MFVIVWQTWIADLCMKKIIIPPQVFLLWLFLFGQEDLQLPLVKQLLNWTISIMACAYSMVLNPRALGTTFLVHK